MLLQQNSANQQLHLSEPKKIIHLARLLILKWKKFLYKKAAHSGFSWLIWLLAVY
jgi:hypothetical protein